MRGSNAGPYSSDETLNQDLRQIVQITRKIPTKNSNLTGRITVQLTSYLICLDSAALLELN